MAAATNELVLVQFGSYPVRARAKGASGTWMEGILAMTRSHIGNCHRLINGPQT
jgi:hypothetical protein